MLSIAKEILRVDDLSLMSHIAKPKKYYVYAAFISGECVYIGHGIGPRWRHCVNGNSHSKKLNAAVNKFYDSGENPVLPKVLIDGISENLSVGIEARLISKFLPNFNKVKPKTSKQLKQADKHGPYTKTVKKYFIERRNAAGGAKAFYKLVHGVEPTENESMAFNNKILRSNYNMRFLGFLVERLEIHNITLSDFFNIKR